jgi:hypothetical protein
MVEGCVEPTMHLSSISLLEIFQKPEKNNRLLHWKHGNLPEDLGESFDLVFLLKLLDTRQKHRTLQVHSSLVHSWYPAEYILVQKVLWAVCCIRGWDQVCKCSLSDESWDKRWVIIFPFPLSFYVFCNVGCILFVLVWQNSKHNYYLQSVSCGACLCNLTDVLVCSRWSEDKLLCQ